MSVSLENLIVDTHNEIETSDLCPHGVVVILANKNDRERPELGQVEGLADLALVGCAVSVQGKVDPAVPGVFVRKGDARPERNLQIEGAMMNRVEFSYDDIIPGLLRFHCRRRSSWCTCACCRPSP